MENSIKMDDLGVPPCQETSIWFIFKRAEFCFVVSKHRPACRVWFQNLGVQGDDRQRIEAPGKSGIQAEPQLGGAFIQAEKH